jgi:nitrate reductase assembly molybdenum cofactor insertion protein NarJ
MKKFYDEMNEGKVEEARAMSKHEMDEIQFTYTEMFEDAQFAIESLAEYRHLPNKYRGQLMKMVKDLRKMQQDVIKDIGNS